MSCDLILRLMDTPEQIFGMASQYLKVYLLGFIFMYIGFLIAAILRGIGDTMTPLVFMAIGVAITAILDPILIIGIGPFPRLGIVGTAYASVISQAIATILGLIYLNRKNHIVSFNPKKLILDGHITLLIFKIGLPSIVQQSLVSIGSAFVTTFVNAFGAAATNAFSAVSRVDMVAIMPAMSLSLAVSALTGQNLGAGKPERVKEIFKWGVVMTTVITLLVSLLAVIFPRAVLTMFGFGEDIESLTIGVTYLRIVGSAYIFFAIAFISNGVINGAGHTLTTMTFSLLSLWIVRVPFSWILSGIAFERFSSSANWFLKGLSNYVFAPFRFGLYGIWASIVLSFAVIMTVSLAYYFSGRWKKAVIKIKTSPIPEPTAEME